MTAPIRKPRATPQGGASRGRASRGGAPRQGASGGGAPRSDASGAAPRQGASGGGPRGGRGRRADPVRRVAYDVLIAVEQRDAYANLLLPSMLAERGLAGRDAALATELTYGTLRGRGSYDAILGLCSDRGLDRVDPPLREVLRLGTHQLLATRVQPHAAVATSVELAKDLAGQRSAGFVNAVLRKVATRDLETWIGVAAPRRDTDLLGHLAVRYSHPRWMVEVVAEALGEDPASGMAGTEAALAADGTRPRVTLCVVPGLADPAELVAAGGEPATWSPFGAYLAGGDPGAIEAVSARRAAVQDEASQLAAIAVARAGLTGQDRWWLDMCAGPGGKARLLAGLAAQREAHLVATDARPHRARLTRDAVSVTGAAAAAAVDGTMPAWRPAAFDRVLVDVPCSGIGALRRRPEARWRRSAQDVLGLGGLQRSLLRSALDAVRPGGVVGYVTCSPHRGETRDVLADVLRGRDDIEVLDAPGVLAEVPDLRCPEPDGRYAQFWPHRHGTDAIFLALLRRREDAGRPGR
ncbi:MAG TPA: transcription antitermination factor NusB [Streptosporangiaceae bacterium]